MGRRVALITGGTGGIGTAIVRRLADDGHRVASNYRNADRAKAWQQEMSSAGYEVALAEGDVSSPESAAALVAKIS